MSFDELTRDELRELAPRATVVVPIGSTEQHGPHLPVGTDVTIISAIAERAVEQASRQIAVTLAPTLPFGFAHHHLSCGGTISIAMSTYLAGAERVYRNTSDLRRDACERGWAFVQLADVRLEIWTDDGGADFERTYQRAELSTTLSPLRSVA